MTVSKQHRLIRLRINRLYIDVNLLQFRDSDPVHLIKAEFHINKKSQWKLKIFMPIKFL